MLEWTVEFLDEARGEFEDWPEELKSGLIRIFDRIESMGLERVREPLVKHIGGRIWEMRPSGDHVIGRALYAAVKGKRVVVALAFIKKAQKTPRRLVEIALMRVENIG